MSIVLAAAGRAALLEQTTCTHPSPPISPLCYTSHSLVGDFSTSGGFNSHMHSSHFQIFVSSPDLSLSPVLYSPALQTSHPGFLKGFLKHRATKMEFTIFPPNICLQSSAGHMAGTYKKRKRKLCYVKLYEGPRAE